MSLLGKGKKAEKVFLNTPEKVVSILKTTKYKGFNLNGSKLLGYDFLAIGDNGNVVLNYIKSKTILQFNISEIREIKLNKDVVCNIQGGKPNFAASYLGAKKFGVAGAIVGSTLGSRTTSSNMASEIALHLSTNSFDNPLISIIIAHNLEVNSKQYIASMDVAMQILATFELLMSQNEQDK